MQHQDDAEAVDDDDDQKRQFPSYDIFFFCVGFHVTKTSFSLDINGR